MSVTRTGSNVERRFVTTPLGRIHVAMAGTGFPVLLLHQTPRSWDEYRDVLPLLGRDFRAIAMDTLGFGDSDRPAGDPSIGAMITSRQSGPSVAQSLAGRAALLELLHEVAVLERNDEPEGGRLVYAELSRHLGHACAVASPLGQQVKDRDCSVHGLDLGRDSLPAVAR